IAVTTCRGQEIDRQRFIGLGRGVFSDALPEVVLGDRRRITKRPAAPDVRQNGGFGYQGVRFASGSAFTGIGFEGGRAGGSMRQRVGMLASCTHATGCEFFGLLKFVPRPLINGFFLSLLLRSS